MDTEKDGMGERLRANSWCALGVLFIWKSNYPSQGFETIWGWVG